MFDYIFFDLDGTLTDPALGITNSFIHALKYFGIEMQMLLMLFLCLMRNGSNITHMTPYQVIC